jgi:ubiquinone/menaquinone biosynthesis C-methylase UbiE
MDKVMAAFVIHEVPDVAKAINEAKRILKTGGILMIVEWEGVETAIGPPLEDKIPSQEMAEMLQGAGFIPEVVRLNESHYAVVAKLA